MGDLVAINGEAATDTPTSRRQVSECADEQSASFLLMGTDARGKRCWFLRVRTSGLYERRYGPFCRHSDALQCYDRFLDTVQRALCDLHNDSTALDRRAYEFVQWPARLRPKGAQR